MKTCRVCQEEKPLSDFPKRSRNPDGLDTMCKGCKRDYDNAHYRSHPERRTYINQVRNVARQQTRQFIYDYLRTHPCVDCGESDPIVLTFDHRDDVVKVADISKMTTYSIPAVEREIAKCDVRCANCHARRTALPVRLVRRSSSVGRAPLL